MGVKYISDTKYSDTKYIIWRCIINNLELSLKIVKIFKKINGVVMKKIRGEFMTIDITGPQGMLIGILFHKGEMKISEISKTMGLSISTVSGIIDRLEEHGRVIRKRSKEDRRVVKVSLTDNFREEAKKRHLNIEKHLGEFVKSADDKQLEVILNGLEALENVVNKSLEKENIK